MEEQQQTQEVQQVEQTSTEPGLEDVYKEFNVTPTQAQPKEQTQQPRQQEQRPEVSIPDPALDPDGHRAFMRNNVLEQQQVKGALTAVAQHLQKYERERAEAAEKADIQKAVETVNSNLKADPDFAEIALAQQVRKDPKFAAIWNGRSQNPAALDKALKALGTELSKKFEFRTDPQLTENQRAMKEATQTKAVGAPQESLTDRLGKLVGREFDAETERIRNSGV